MKRLGIFAHFDVHGRVDPHVCYLVRSLAATCERVVFVTTSEAPVAYLETLNLPVHKIISRQNLGLDFCSWQVGLRNSPDWIHFDEVVLCNDSIYGPVFPLNEMFTKMEGNNCDFWGITLNSEVEFHLQSYFLVFKKNAIVSSVFHDFWRDLVALDDKNEVISRYEVGLTQKLRDAGLVAGYYFKHDAVRLVIKHIYWHFRSKPRDLIQLWSVLRKLSRRNPTHYMWLDMLQQRMPFVKVELLRDNPRRMDISSLLDELKNRTDYPVQLISDHLSRVSKNNALG